MVTATQMIDELLTGNTSVEYLISHVLEVTKTIMIAKLTKPMGMVKKTRKEQKEIEEALDLLEISKKDAWMFGVGSPDKSGYFRDLIPAQGVPGSRYTTPDWPWAKQVRKKYGANLAFNKEN